MRIGFVFGSIIFNLFYSWVLLYLRRTLFVISDSHPQTVIWSTLHGKAVRVEEGTQSAFFLSSSREKKGAYPTNVVDLLVVACKPIILAGNQSCSQCHELVKCVTRQGSSLGVFYRGLVNKGYILGARPSVSLTKAEPNSQRLSFIARVPLFSFFFFLRGNDMRTGANYLEIRLFHYCVFFVYVCACFGTNTEYFWL